MEIHQRDNEHIWIILRAFKNHHSVSMHACTLGARVAAKTLRACMHVYRLMILIGPLFYPDLLMNFNSSKKVELIQQFSQTAPRFFPQFSFS